MKDILFRGKRPHSGEWVYGSLIRMDENSDQVFIFPLHNFASSMICSQIVANKMTPVVPETVGQYTGKKDKNGTKIFNGDIVLYSYDFIADTVCGSNRYETEAVECEVYFKDGAYWIRSTVRLDMDFLGDVFDDCEVIGNIHDKEIDQR